MSALASSSARGAELRQVLSGTTVLTDTNTQVSATLSLALLDTTKAFLVLSVRGSHNSPENIQVSGRIADTSTVTFRRFGDVGNVTIQWYVAEFASGVFVQRGQSALNPAAPPGDIDITLGTPVDLAKSFPILSYRTDGNTFDLNDNLRAKLTSTTNLHIVVGDDGNGSRVEWQVIEYTGASVRTGDVSFGSGSAGQNVPLAPAADDTASWLVYSYDTVGAPPDVGQSLVRGLLNPGGASLDFDRSNTGSTIDLTWYLVEFADGTSVQHASEPFGAAETQRDATLSNPVGLTSTIAVGGHYSQGGRSSYSANDNPGVAWFTHDLTTSTNLQLTRAFTGSSPADIGWFVIDFLGCTPLSVNETATTITVSVPGSFEMRFNGALGGTIDRFFDLAEDPTRLYDLAGSNGGSGQGMYVNGIRVSGQYYNVDQNDEGAKLDLLEATETRVRVRQEAFYEQDPGGPVILGGIKARGDYTIHPAGRLALRFNQRTTKAVTYTTSDLDFNMHQTAGAPLNSWTAYSESGGGLPNSGLDDFLLIQNEVAGARTDFLQIIYKDWCTSPPGVPCTDSNGHLAQADEVSSNVFGGEWRNSFFKESSGATIPAGTSESWDFLTYFKPTTFVNHADVAVTTRSADYRSPAAPGITVGTSWQDPDENTGSDNFNEAEAAYLFNLDQTDGLRFDLDGAATPRYHPFFKIRRWRSLVPPTSITLDPDTTGGPTPAVTLSRGVHFRSDVKPVSRAYFGRTLWHSSLESAGALTNPNVGDAGSSAGASFVAARYGGGAQVASGGGNFVGFDITDFDETRGSLDFWFQPTFDSNDGVEHNIAGFRFDVDNEWVLRKGSPNNMSFVIEASGLTSTTTIAAGNFSWRAMDWVHLRIEWDDAAPIATQQRIFVNGVEPPHSDGSNNYVAANLTTATPFRIGGYRPGANNAPGIYDEIYAYGGSAGEPTSLAHGGLAGAADELLATGSNFTLGFTSVDAEGRGEYAYFGSDSKYSGLNVVLATPGQTAGSLDVRWEFWNGTSWTTLTVTDETNHLTGDGTIYWTGDPAGWSEYSVKGGADLYYVRAHLADTSAAYTTAPVEWIIKTDILLFQYCGDVTTDDDEFTFGVPIPTAVELVSFEATGVDGRVELTWQTASELNNLGFHIYRASSAGGPDERLTTRPIPGLGSSPEGASYRYHDTDVTNGVKYDYELEDIETTGRTERHGPVSATPEAGVVSESEPPGNEEAGDTEARLTYGSPEASGFRIVPRRNGALLELDIGGFVAVAQQDGSVRLEVPGLQELLGSSLPVKRAWVEAVAGRDVRIESIQIGEVERFDALRPGSSLVAELEASARGTVRAHRRRRGARATPHDAAKLVETAYQGETKKALFELSPFRWDGRALLLAKKVRVRVTFRGREASPPRRERSAVVALRLVTQTPGLYAVPLEQLVGRRGGPFRLSRQGEDTPYHVEDSVVYFWSEGAAANPYGTEAVYELELGVAGARMELSEPNGSADAYWHEASWEENRYYQAGLLAGPDVWLWELLLAPERKSFTFEVSDLAPGSSRLEVWLQATSDFPGVEDHHVRVYVNGSFAGEGRWDGKTAHKLEAELVDGVLREGANELVLESVGDTGAQYSMVMLDRFRLRNRRSTTSLERAAYVIDVTEDTPRWVPSRSGFDAERAYVAVDQPSRPVIRNVPREGLRLSRRADYLVIGPKNLLDAARPLLRHRSAQGLRVVTAPTHAVASEFGHGELTPEAIRNFVRHAYHEWQEPRLRYVLLLGDATYDFKDYLGTGVQNQLPPYMVKTSYLWTASDPAYAAVNGDDLLPDVAIGRLPAKTTDELASMVSKILDYENGGLELDAPFVLVADDSDAAGNFQSDAEELASTLLVGHDTQRLYLDELGAADTRAAILQSFNAGAAAVSYLGHGGIHLWADENVFNSNDVDALSPQSAQPILLTMNCLNGYFHFPYFDSLAEALLKADGRGAIAAFSPTGLSLNDPAHRLHTALLRELFEGNHQRLGDAVLAAQQAYAQTGAFPELLSIFHLLGDPALNLR